MITTFVASSIRLFFSATLNLHVRLVTWSVDVTDWMEDRRVLDRPTPWLCGLLFAALLWWLLHDAWS